MLSARIIITQKMPITILRRNNSSLLRIFNEVSLPGEINFESTRLQLSVGTNRLNEEDLQLLKL
jgi:hypothetical protein